MEPRPVAAGVYNSTESLRQHLRPQVHMQHSGGMGRPDTTAAADARDQQQQDLARISMDLPITYMPFKFENRRVRIDWRLLHGVDIDKLVRDTDLDTLEQLVTCVTWGDIEAEDTRHLSEGNFVKVYRLAQLLLEYLLYVQENLKYTNGVLDQSRCTAVLHAQGLSTRCRDLYNELKHSKRELKRAHKTVKTFELMAAAVGGAAIAQAAAAAATPTKQEAPPPQQQQPQVQQQQGSVMTAGEMLLQSQLSELTERLTLAVCEAERLRTERQELQYQIRHLHDTLAAKLSGNSRSSSGSGASKAARDSSTAAAVEVATAAAVAAAQQEQQQLFMAELQCAQAQIDELQAQNKELRSQCKRQSDAATSAAESSLIALRAELEKKAQELVRLEGELRERDSSIKVFQTSNTALQQQLEALQRQLTSPEATTPSFVAKQRQQLAAAASAQAGLQAENTQLRQELLELRLALESNRGLGSRGGSRSGAKGSTGGAAGLVVEEAEEDALAAAERLLSGDGDEEGAADWKVAEIERLQEENRQLHAKVASLQDALNDLEAENCRLEQRVAAATAAGYVAASPAQSPSAAAAAAGATAAAESAGLAGVLEAPGWTSVSSSGPAAELTAADLATGGASLRQAAVVAAAAAADVETDTAVDSVTLEQSDSSLGTATAAAAEGQAGAAGTDVKAGAETEHGAVGDVAAGKVLFNAGSRSTAGGSSDGGRITAYRPSRDGTTAAPAAAEADAAPSHQQQHSLELGRGPSNADSSSYGGSNVSSQGGSSHVGVNHAGSSTVGSNVSSSNGSSAGQPARGAIDQAAAAQLKSLVADMQEKLDPQELATEYDNVCSDWDKPFDLTEAEKEQFRQLLPHEVTGLRDVLCSQQHAAEEVSAAKPGMLSAINRALDTQLASYGIHPGRTGLSNIELLAAMKMLGERREAFEANLSPAQRDEVEVTRFGLLLHPYHALQSVMATLPDGPDGKKHLPAVAPALASAVRPPASALAQPPAPTQQASHSPTKRQEMYSTATYHAAPSAGAGAAGAGSAAGGLAGGLRSSGGGVGAGRVYQTRSPSPLGSEAAAEAIAKAAASGSFSPMSAALHAKQALGRGGSPPSSSTGRSVSPLGTAGSPLAYASSAQAAAGWNTVAAGAAAGNSASAGQGRAMQQQQQPQQQVMRMSPADSSVQQHQQQVSAAAALATKQYLASSFDSDDF